MIKNCIWIILITVFANTANAAFNGLSIHSRANCINNESISWDATRYRILKTVSQHHTVPTPPEEESYAHEMDTDWHNTWRSAAVHWGEGHGGWRVVGFHLYCKNKRERNLGMTDVSDCSIYNGWWDKSDGNEKDYI